MRGSGHLYLVPATYGCESRRIRPPSAPWVQNPENSFPTRVAGRCDPAGGRLRPPAFILHCFRPLGPLFDGKGSASGFTNTWWALHQLRYVKYQRFDRYAQGCHTSVPDRLCGRIPCPTPENRTQANVVGNTAATPAAPFCRKPNPSPIPATAPTLNLIGAKAFVDIPLCERL